MKKSTGKLLIGLAVGVLLAGGIGAIAYGSDGFTNSDISTWFDGEWRAINFEDQTKEYTGSKIEPDIVLPDGFTYEITKIEKDGEEVDLETGAVASGDYVFTIAITKTSDGETRNYFINLKIDAEGELPTKVESNYIQLRTLKVAALESGNIEKTISYTVTGNQETYNDFYVQVSFFDSSSGVDQYLTASVDNESKIITLNCLQAFNKQIYVDLISSINPKVSARITCDYKEKLLSEGKVNISGVDITLNDTTNIEIETVAPVYSIGTVTADDKVTAENFSVDFNYVKAGGYDWDALFIADSSLKSSISSKWKVNGVEYNSRQEVLNVIKTNVNDYFENLITGKTGNTYTISEFRNLCKYEYATHMTSTYQYASDLYTISDYFIEKFNESGNRGSSMNWEVTAYNKSATVSITKISVDGQPANINLAEDSVVF